MTDSEEIQMVLLKKLPIVILGAVIGLGLVWLALQFIPAAVVQALAP